MMNSGAMGLDTTQLLGEEAFKQMIGCTRCGHWHTDAERALDKDLSCTEVKQYWSRIRNEHNDLYGHLAQITMDGSGTLICFKCQRKITG